MRDNTLGKPGATRQVVGLACSPLRKSIEDHKRAAVGRAFHGVDIWIVDVDSTEVSRGTISEIAVRGPPVMLG